MPPALVRHYLSKIVNTPQLLKRFSKKPRVGDRDLLWGQRFDVLQRSLPTVSVLIVNVGVFVSNLLLRVNESFLDWQTCRFSVRLSKATTEFDIMDSRLREAGPSYSLWQEVLQPGLATTSICQRSLPFPLQASS